MKTYKSLYVRMLVALLVGSLFITGCHIKQKKELKEIKRDSTVGQSETNKGWQELFDGNTFKGWRGVGRDVIPGGQWKIEDGAIKNVGEKGAKSLADGQPAAGGDIMTISTFDNFELYFEWKISKGGNSGVKYNVSEELSMKYPPKYSALGFEFQLLDDNGEEYKKLSAVHLTGALYDMILAQNKVLKPVGEYNTGRIIVNGNHVEHWLNGGKVVEYELGSARLDSLYKKSKYKDYPGFLTKKKGHIVLQSHKTDAWFQNIRIRVI